MKRFLSLGAGVQSSTLALMIAHGELPMVDGAIFADTQSEPLAVYEYLDWLEKQLPFPVYRVTQGNLGATVGATRPKGKFLVVDIPVFTSVDGIAGGLINRSCTRDYKIVPIRRKIRELLGITGKRSPKEPIATSLIGISLDEASRMKPSRDPWLAHEWPLIDLRMSRTACLSWMRSHDYPLPSKSSCTFCPFHSNAEWRRMKDDPQAWSDIVTIDRRLRAVAPEKFRTKGTLYLHRSLRPIEEVDFSTPEENGQVNMFENECEGLCGV